MDFYKRALALREETISHRRWLHSNAEVGLHMPKGQTYVMEQLRGYGLDPHPCGHGVIAELGQEGGRTILLRADMDALPMPEESGESFSCPTGTEAHTCGHDFHAAMLLTAAKILKENESMLSGRVRFMFQPAEETFEGAKDMLANGVLEGVDAALAYHVGPGRMPVGLFMYNSGKTMMYSVDGFRITIHGRGAHGAYPHSSIDPINIGVHVYLALESLIAREADPGKACVLTIGNFSAGSAPNIIPDTAVLQGTLRTNDSASREKLVRRLKEVALKTAEVFGGMAQVETVVLLSKGEIDSKKVRVEFSLEDMDMSGFQKGATYEQIKAYVLEHTGLKVSSLYISQIKRKCGLDVGQNYNLSKKEDAKVPKCPPEKEAAIRDALKYFQMI